VTRIIEAGHIARLSRARDVTQCRYDEHSHSTLVGKRGETRRVEARTTLQQSSNEQSVVNAATQVQVAERVNACAVVGADNHGPRAHSRDGSTLHRVTAPVVCVNFTLTLGSCHTSARGRWKIEVTSPWQRLVSEDCELYGYGRCT